jgi:hypothetical protein
VKAEAAMHELTVAKVASRNGRRWIAVWSACLIAMVNASPGAHAQSVPNQSTPQSTPLQSTPLQSRPAPSKPPEYPAVLTTGPHVVEIQAGGKTFRLGASCKRRTDTEPGVYRKDGCDRWYCGRADAKDTSEILPNLAAETGCVWQVEASNQCVCRKLAGDGTPRRGSP